MQKTKLLRSFHPVFLSILTGFGFALFNLFTLIHLNTSTEQVFIPPKQAEELLIDQDRLTVIASPDGMQWVMHSQKAAEENRWRLPRWTYTDNHPYGRPLLWPSLHSYWLRFLGWTFSLSTSLPISVAIAKAAVYCNPMYLLLFSIPIAWFGYKVHGIKSALYVPILALLLSNPKYGLRFPDHHLLHICLTFLFLLVLSDDKSKPNQQHQWITAGAVLGLLFWASALSAAIITIAAFLPFPFSQKKGFQPSIKNLFLLTGTASLVICVTYLWDYYPFYGIHMECVNPIYAVFLILSTFLFQQWCVIVSTGFDLKQISTRRIIYPSIISLAVVLLVIINIRDWYTPSNLFLARWMKLIGESRPIDLSQFFFFSNLKTAVFLLTVLGVILDTSNRQRIAKFHLIFIGIVLLFSLNQNRISDFFWPSITILVVSICSFKRTNPIGVLLVSLVIFMGINQFQNQRVTANAFRELGDTEKLGPYVAKSYNWQIESQKLLESIQTESGSILTVPNLGVYLNYYTKLPVYGTYYWENYDGMLRNMHMVFRRKDPSTDKFPDILEFLKAAKVSFLCVPMENLDLRLSYTIYGSRDQIRVPEDCFFGYLKSLREDQMPDWLELINETEKTRLFKLLPK